MAVDNAGIVYVADFSTHKISRITPQGVISVVAGDGQEGLVNGAVAAARFKNPADIAIDAAGDLYVADAGNHCIRKISGGQVTTVAGNGSLGWADGTGAAAQFHEPHSIDVGPSGAIYIADTLNHRIRKMTAAGVVTTWAGMGAYGHLDGNGTITKFNFPFALDVVANDVIYVADTLNHRIRKIDSNRDVTTIAGMDSSGFVDGAAISAKFNSAEGIAVNDSGDIYISDALNRRIRKLSGGQVTTYAGDGVNGHLDGPLLSARFGYPAGLAIGADGTLYVGDEGSAQATPSIRALKVP